MKLSETQLRDKVPSGNGPGDFTNRLEASRGWELTFEAGIITAINGPHKLLIPIGNVTWMRLMVVETKPKPPAKAA